MFNLSRSLLTFVSLFLFLSCYSQEDSNSSDCVPKKERKCKCKEKPEIDPNRQTSFPQHPKDDYNPIDYHVKIAVPIHADSSRVWVKGNERDRFVQFFSNGQPISTVQQLSEPYYTAVISIPGDYTKVHVHFSDQQSDLVNSEKNVLCYPKNKAFLDDSDTSFSMLFYGCFQPFYVKKGESALLSGKVKKNKQMRRLFEKVALGDTVAHRPSEESTYIKKPLISNPKIIIGTGDQIYTDAGYKDSDFMNHPLSAWSHKCNNPYPLLSPSNYINHLNETYSHFNSFNCFQSAFTRLPSINVWDDHEIRDGWGSHGDEYNNDGTISSALRPYYYSSRKAFIDHQFSTGPESINEHTYDDNISLHQINTINGINIFSFDLRSNRNICEPRVISSSQLKAFQNWCNALSPDQEVVIISSIPMFYTQNDSWLLKFSQKFYKGGEIQDDSADGWSEDHNRPQRDSIVELLIELRKKNVKPIIISGDVHIGGILSVWYKNEEKKAFERLCYEFIFSGLSHESLGEGRDETAALFQHKIEKNRSDYPGFEVGENDINFSYDLSKGRLNFGALEFNKTALTVASVFYMEDGFVAENYVELDWNKSFSSFYNKASKPFLWNFRPGKKGKVKLPKVPYNEILIDSLD